MLTNIVTFRELVYQLFRRDFLMAYKKSVIGIGWIFLSPLVGIASWVLLNSAGILQPGDIQVDYPAFVLFSSSLWGLFMGFYSSAAGTLNAGSAFILQVRFPHEVLLVKQTAQHLATFSIGFLVNIGVLLLRGVVPDWTIIFLPLLALPLFFLAAGVGLMVSVFSVVITDVMNITNIVLGIVMYITPIIYRIDKIDSPILSVLVKYNPLTYLVGEIRDLMLFGYMSHPVEYIVSVLFAFGLFMLSWRLFYISEHKIIEKII